MSELKHKWNTIFTHKIRLSTDRYLYFWSSDFDLLRNSDIYLTFFLPFWIDCVTS
jgi:hypothetical protein